VSAQLFLCDAEEDYPKFLPFALSRPLGELRYGAWLLRERWGVRHGLTVAGHLSAPHLRGFTEPGAPPVVPAPGDRDSARLVFRSTFVPAADATPGEVPREPTRFVDGAGTTIGAALPPGTPWLALSETAAWPARAIAGKRLEGVWQLIGDLPAVLREDLAHLAARRGPGTVPAACTVLGDPSLVLVEDALVEPHVVFDVRDAPVWLGPGAEVRAFTRLTGPMAVHAGTRIVGGQLRESSVGPKCVVHGEVSTSLFLGYANKAHDGFLGHSVVGRWANLGAGTITSNLKNTYGPVRLNLGSERVETGLTFLGALIGDQLQGQEQRQQEQQQRIEQQKTEITKNRALLEELRRRNIEARETDRGVSVNLPNVLFQFDRAELTPDGRDRVKQMSNIVNDKAQGRKISVEGHASRERADQEAYNQELSERRARAVAGALESNGVERNRIAAKGVGTRFPVASNETEEGRRKNRRVEVTIEN